ncbi:MAG: ATP-binding protein [Prevotella sp.]|jgi:predicted AAA+ superfamily ATPase
MNYHSRIADALLKERLSNYRAVLIEGPRGSGKSTTAIQQSNSSINLTDPDKRPEILDYADIKNKQLLKGDTPRSLCEWQLVKDLWKNVKASAKRRTENGNYILTESQDFDATAPKLAHFDTLGRLKMYPMSLWESHESSGEISLSTLIDQPNFVVDGIKSKAKLADVIYAACRGGWPEAIDAPEGTQLKVARAYLKRVCEEDISMPDNIKRSPSFARIVMRAYANHVSTKAQINDILADVRDMAGYMAYITLKLYKEALCNIYVLQEVPAWNPSVHHWTSIRHHPTRCFCDPSYAVASLGLSPETLRKDPQMLSQIFKNLCFRDLRAYSQHYDGNVQSYADRFGCNIDAVVELPSGYYALIQCATSPEEIEAGARKLNYEKKHIIKRNLRYPDQHFRLPGLLMVLTPTGKAYTRPDGIRVVPLTCLKD